MSAKKTAHSKGLLFDIDENKSLHFIIVTSSDLTEILRSYRESELASKAYFEELSRQGRIEIFHGPDLLKMLRQHYFRAHAVPTELKISSAAGWLNAGNAFLGIVKGADIKRLHAEFGEALFFENIRDFIGTSPNSKQEERVTVNEEITRTIREQPARMLERNNGIVLRAASVRPDGQHTLHLFDASIVNGCQTTMCLALSSDVADDCCIALKVVQTNDAWEITKTANSQNNIRQIELKLAKFLRPQLLRRAANDLGYGFQEGISATARLILNEIYQDHVDYEEIKYLYLGLFSTRPGNIFGYNYVDIRYDVLEALISNEEVEKYVFATMFLITKRTQEAAELCNQSLKGTPFAELFKRFFDEDKSIYRMYFAILALCAATQEDISDRKSDTIIERDRMVNMLKQIRILLENKAEEFSFVYQQAFLIAAESTLEFESEQEVQKNMHSIIKRGFKINYQKLRLRLQTMPFSRSPI
ncbi:AIPR family protein [Siccirubricoccus sp. G192]|uniref:AIPR family protein n=1 Tax=Siccirubricoccus sp. G192 TaxID=2849651 RepID=UPI001C2BBD17|nr:AIPR family protein [Siccirubricoccus sp. G192]MBV1796968.1 AIPR family protein [Siccirubricoccus sp. G192]